MKPLNNQIRKVSTLFFSILCIVACENDSNLFNESNGDAIAFETTNNWNLVEKTRGLYDKQEITIEDGLQIGVFGYVMPSDAAAIDRPTSGTSADFFRNQEVIYSSSKNAWGYSPIKYWPHQNKLYLCGYYPYTNTELDNEKVKWELDGDQVVLSAYQAYPAKGSTIHFEMKHRMQLIRFRFVSPQMVYSQISKIEFNNMPKYAYLDPTNNDFYGETSITYTFTNDKEDGGGSGVKTDFNIYQTVNDITEYYFVVPTKMKTGDVVTTINTFTGKIYFHDETAPDEINSQEFTVTIDEKLIVEGRTHLITLNLRDDFVDNSVVTFEESNCYMINPLPDTDNQQRYRIPISRVFDFWEKYTATPLGKDEAWVAEVIWQDVNTQQFEFVNDETSGSGDGAINPAQFNGKGSDAYISFKPKKGAEGNVLIGIRSNKSEWNYQNDGYLWTFHLWFTNYNPTYSMPWQENKYIYKVEGGEVHRYPSSSTYHNLWAAGGEYDQKYIMDRNLGARDADLPNAITGSNGQWDIPGVLGYQFGRPAPMPSSGATLWVMKPNGSSVSIAQYIKPAITGDKNKDGNMVALDKQATMEEAIKHPCTFYIRPGATADVTTSWCSKASQYVENIWHDKYTTKNDTKKSFFDPSPQGWKLPKKGTWNGFGKSLPYGDNRDYVWKNGANTSEIIRFYAICIAQNRQSGYTSYEKDPGTDGSNLNGGLYVATRLDGKNAQSLEMMTGVFSEPNSQLDSFGESVRCVQE